MRKLAVFLIVAAVMFGLFFGGLLVTFALPHRAIKERAQAFDGHQPPAVTQRAHVTKRWYYHTGSTKGTSPQSYSYFLTLGDLNVTKQTVEIDDIDLWWKLAQDTPVAADVWNGNIVLIRYGNMTTPTRDNPDWQLRSDERGLTMILYALVICGCVGIASAAYLRLT